MQSSARRPDLEVDPNPHAAPTAGVGVRPSSVTVVGRFSWSMFSIIGVLTGTAFWLFWSLWMAVATGHRLLTWLVGPGAMAGLFFGLFFGGFMAFVMRSATASLPVADRDELLSRIDSELTKLRYRPTVRTDVSRTYEPRALIRTHAFDVTIQVEANQATMVGPRATLQALKKALER
jgi:hypothetical protein